MFPTEELRGAGAWRGQEEMAAADCDCCRDERCQNGTRLQGALPDALQGSLKHLPRVARHSSDIFCHSVTYLVCTIACRAVYYAIPLANIDDIC